MHIPYALYFIGENVNLQGLTEIADLPGNFCELEVGANSLSVQQFILELLIPIWFTNLFLMLDGQRPIVQQLFFSAIPKTKGRSILMEWP